jgi:hypothetical protein
VEVVCGGLAPRAIACWLEAISVAAMSLVLATMASSCHVAMPSLGLMPDEQPREVGADTTVGLRSIPPERALKSTDHLTSGVLPVK